MNDQATQAIAAGWYDDPTDAKRVRWWNGMTWTDHVTDKPDAAPAALQAVPAAAPESDSLAEVRALEARFGVGTSDIPIIDDAALDAAYRGPAAEPWTAPTEDEAELEPATTTGSAWLIAMIPLMAAVVLAVAGYVALWLFDVPAIALAIAVPLLLGGLWALADISKLKKLGVPRPSRWWAFAGIVPLVYLIVRRVYVRGNGPIVLFGAQLAIAAAGILALNATGATTPLLTALEVQDYARSYLVEKEKSATSITCPMVIESARPGTLYTCDAVRADGTAAIVWVGIEGPNDFSLAYQVR